MIAPSLVLSVLVGVFWTAAYVLVRNSAGGRLPLVAVAAVLGAWAGDAVGARLGIDVLRIGDFRLVAASVVACAGIAIVAVIAVLGPTRARAS
ncbi:MAG TPA: hypothetical protein VEY67_05385 [Candidatus Dormibacteraeota bacterium]|nr:hypothetical protein [Candidatus Dormibacteraeota bacterium]